MFWYIGLIVSVILLILGIVLYNKSCEYDWIGWILGMVSVIFLIIAIIVIPICTICDKNEVNTFIKQKEYIELHVAKNDIEDAALTTKKIELNEWLYNSQYFKINYSYFSFYPDQLLELTPIN